MDSLVPMAILNRTKDALISSSDYPSFVVPYEGNVTTEYWTADRIKMHLAPRLLRYQLCSFTFLSSI